jgi:hypothetical protein
MIGGRDIVRELEDWLAELSGDARFRRRPGEAPDVETDLVRRAIAEINGLRERLNERRGTLSIAAEDLNASNDE